MATCGELVSTHMPKKSRVKSWLHECQPLASVTLPLGGTVVGKSGYGRTQIFLKHTFTFTKQLFFIPNVVFTAAFASRSRRRSCHSAYPFISACAKGRLAL